MASHTTVTISKDLYNSVRNLIESNPNLGFTNVAEFCKEAIRKKISDEKNNLNMGNDMAHLKSTLEAIHEAIGFTLGETDSLFNVISEPVAIFSAPEGNLVTFNDAFKEMSGYTRKELRTRNLQDFIRPEDVSRVKENFQKRIQGKPAPTKYLIKARNKKGDIRVVEVNAKQYIKNGSIIGVGVLLREPPKK